MSAAETRHIMRCVGALFQKTFNSRTFNAAHSKNKLIEKLKKFFFNPCLVVVLLILGHRFIASPFANTLNC